MSVADPVAFGSYGPSAAMPVDDPLTCQPCDVTWSAWDSLLCWYCGTRGQWPPPGPPRTVSADPLQVVTTRTEVPG